jgi:CRAL/TRIO, N-terminal domain
MINPSPSIPFPLSMHDQDKTHADVLETFRRELFDEGILHEGDTIGTDDESLLYAGPPFSTNDDSAFFSYRRFLRARKFHLAQAKKMILDCQEWRRTVEGVGMDELYRRIDPFDVSELCLMRMSPDRAIVCRARSSF